MEFAAEVGYPAGAGHASGYLFSVGHLISGSVGTFLSSSVYEALRGEGFFGLLLGVSCVGMLITIFMAQNLKRLREDVNQARISYRERELNESVIDRQIPSPIGFDDD